MRGYEWMDQAVCAQVGSEIFFPVAGANPYEAKQVCRNCPVKAECLDYALNQGMVHGVWGGLTEAERRRIKTRRVA